MSVGNELRDLLDGSVAEALAASEVEIAQLRAALKSRVLIGQAQGILMARLDIDAETATGYLKRMSMHTNRKMIEIAEEIAQTRTLPDFDR